MSEPLQLTTLGEALVVMDPVSKGPLRYVSGFEKHVGGAELNVAVGLSRLGHRVGWTGRLGEDEFGKEILAIARGEGVDVSRATIDPDGPTGIYFKEWRALDQLGVFYFRGGSAAERVRVGWTGRLGEDEFGKEILAIARGEGVDVSRATIDPDGPTGIYFKEWRALDQLRVYYYRVGSAASRMRFDELDLEYLFSAEILHL